MKFIVDTNQLTATGIDILEPCLQSLEDYPPTPVSNPQGLTESENAHSCQSRSQ
jgi:hypothetical protein